MLPPPDEGFPFSSSTAFPALPAGWGSFLCWEVGEATVPLPSHSAILGINSLREPAYTSDAFERRGQQSFLK